MDPQILSSCSIIIPVFNDSDGLRIVLPALFKELQNLKNPWEVILVDDGSSPPINTNHFQPSSIKILRNDFNKGYGAAIKKGILASRYNHVLVMDADGQHDPTYIPLFLQRIIDVDLVIGLRDNPSSSPLWRRPGKWFLSKLVNLLSTHKLKDINCGFRCFKKESILKYMHLCSDRFSFSTSSTMIARSLGYEIGFVNIQAKKRIGNSTVSYNTGFDAMVLIIRMVVLTNPLRIFLPISFFLFLFGSLWGLPYFLQGRGLSVGAFFLIVSGMFIFLLGIVSDQITALIKNEIRR